MRKATQGTPAYCTVVARNYLAHARVLARSLAAHERGARLDVLVLDDPRGEVTGEPFRVLHPEDAGLERGEFLELATAYDTLELATSVKAALLRAELDAAEAAVYLDPDVAVLHQLPDLAALAADHGVVVTPHCRRPVPRDGRTPDESVFLKAGTFNLGFVAVGRGGKEFLDWWDERLRLDCVSALDDGLFVDQKWLDLAAGHFDLHVLDDAGCNVAYWNLHERPVVATDGGYAVEDGPLRFFHFSGYDPAQPHRLTKYHADRPRVTLADQPAVRALCDWYAAELAAAGYESVRTIPVRYARTATGLPIDARMRRIYRDARRRALRDGEPVPPAPFDTESATAFAGWLREPVIEGATGDVSRYAYRLWQEREDLRYHFADLYGAGSGRYVDWLRGSDARRVPVPDELVPEAAGAPRWACARPFEPGVNVVGYVRAECGIGEGARGLVAAVRAAHLPSAVVAYTDTPVRQRHRFDGPAEPPRFAVTVTCVNADETPRLVERLGDQLLDGRWRIGMWAWEVDRMRPEHAAAAGLLDEIWVGSEHTAAAVRAAVGSKPVHVFPLAIEVPAPPPLSRADLGLPEGFLALFCFDFASVAGRKNPDAMIEAFRRAFPGDADARLVVKTVGGDAHLDALERLRLAVADDPRIEVVDGYRTRGEHLAMVASCDVYVSLHRSEGFGLTMAEAMALGRPVVATAYSGNLEFMDSSTAWLVPYELVPVGPGNAPYPEDAVWAEPDVAAAAAALREIRTDPVAAGTRAAAAAEAIARRHGPDARVAFVRERVAAAVVALSERDAPAPLPAPAPAAVPDREPPTPDHIRFTVARGPDVDAPAQSRATLAARKVAHRAIDNYISHQRGVDELIVDLLAAADARRAAGDAALERAVADLATGVRTLTAQLERHRVVADSRTLNLEARLGEILDELSAEPYRVDAEAFRVVRDGRRVLGYDADGVAPEEAYAWFTDAFRGTPALVSDRVQRYVDVLAPHAPVVEVGPGRGELLALLAARGVESRGVDLDPVLAARCAARGLDVTVGDGIAALDAAPAGSLGAVVAIELVEHLPDDAQDALLAAARRALRPGGVLLLETVNPHSSRALKTFWLDPTHVRPLYPEGLLTTVRRHGFPAAHVTFVDGSGDLDRDRLLCGSYTLVARTTA
ncbi:MAG TPA: methyltransferase domain-containing protein [Frankiaceae bacterium]|nr:methyltransferase domain-containing protein [Frankiaceae bacterium]